MRIGVKWIALAVVAMVILAEGTRGQQSAQAGVAFAALSANEQAAGSSAPQDAGPVANPVSATVKAQLTRFQKNMVGAAELMPAEKYVFKPTAEMSTFGHVVMHIAQSNYTLCSKLSGQAAPDSKLADTDGKDKLLAGLKDSFAFCATALANADDTKLGEQIPLFGGRMVPRAAAWITLSDGWNDHYGALAVYLRLNGISPPTAQPPKQ